MHFASLLLLRRIDCSMAANCFHLDDQAASWRVKTAAKLGYCLLMALLIVEAGTPWFLAYYGPVTSSEPWIVVEVVRHEFQVSLPHRWVDWPLVVGLIQVK